MASTALSQQNHPTSDSLQQRMDQFLSMASGLRPSNVTQDSAASDQNVAERGGRETPTSPPYVGRDPYQYQEPSVTSGSNSGGEEDEREMGEGGKRLGGHLNGFASKKRRKQSKPIRIGAGGEAGGRGEEAASSEDGRGQTSSPEQGEYRRGSSADDDDNELEEGERRPGHHFMGEFPLNLSSSRDLGSEKPPMLRVLGAELLQHPDLDPSKFAGLGRPVSPSSLPASLYQSMLPFGLPPFPFPFPGQPSMKPPGVGGSGSQLGRSQIFNPEAYCELCNKEFCNKYFLKTHKANKHGIYSDSPGVSKSPGPPPPHPNASSASSGGGGPTPPISSSSGVDHMGPPTPNSQAGSPFSGAFIAANMGSLRPPFLPLSPGASPSPTHPGSAQQQRMGETGSLNGSQRGDREPGEVNVHMSPRQPHSSGLMSPRDASEFRQSLEERERLMHRDLARGEKENGELRKSLESPRPSGLNFNSMLFGGIPPIDSLRKDDDMRKEQGLLANRAPIPNIPNVSGLSGSNGSSGSMPKGPFTQDKLRQMGVINADAFCEICCKEFCNKYFLRVHKLKKHGICSPDLPPEKVQKILNQMAKEAGKTGNPPPPIIRPPHMMGPGGEKMRPTGPGGPGGIPMRPQGMINLPPLEPLLPQALKDFPSISPAPPIQMEKLMSLREERMSESSTERERGEKGDREIIRINDDSEDGCSKDGQRKQKDNGSDGASNDSVSSDTRENSVDRDRPSSRTGVEPSEDLQRLQSMIMELNSKQAKLHIPGTGDNGNICKVCNKDMENKYFLRAHMMNEHGVLHMEDPAPLSLGPAMSAADRERHEDMMNGDFGPDADQVDFATKFLQQMQKGLLPPLDGGGDERSFLERVKAELAGSPKKLDKDPNRKPASLSRSYCEICKKELCNKYFMKTHMLKMHGINIEGGPPPPGLISSVGGSNSNGPTGGVVCQICKKELCSKYFLKVHLQNSHGLNEDGTPYTPNLKENGGLFAGLFPLSAPPPELLGLASSIPDSEHYFSRLLGEQSELSRERLKELERSKQGPGHNCSLCGEAFPEIVALQVHIIKSHGAFPPETGIFGNPGSPGSLSPGEVERGSNARRATGDEGRTSGAGTPRRDQDEDQRDENPRQSSSSTPRSSATGSGGGGADSAERDKPAGGHPDPAKQFPHIEMLQRHMLSQQFPGLINPLLSGFPGFPPGPGSHLPFPSLQQLFGGKKPDEDEREEGERFFEGDRSKTFSSSEKQKRRGVKRFKCSKCGLKFLKRELCLRHIHDVHSTKRKLHFSPHKNLQPSSATKVRSNYVRQLMELLRVPTSRGTPQKSASEHIMQAFLLKTPKSQKSDDENHNKDRNENAASAVDHNDDDNFVPSVVYLPVSRRVSEPMTVAFNLTPA